MREYTFYKWMDHRILNIPYSGFSSKIYSSSSRYITEEIGDQWNPLIGNMEVAELNIHRFAP